LKAIFHVRATPGCVGPGLFRSHFFIVFLLAAQVVLTGGLSSPFVPWMFGIGLGVLVLYGRSPEGKRMILLQVGLTLVISVLPASVRGPKVDDPYFTILIAFVLLHNVLMTWLGVTALTEAVRAVGEQHDRMRESVLAGTLERTKSLEAVGSKVAHELKNPLAAIKGLVQLLQRNSDDERAKDRLRVISDEVLRMECILREYLSFSRPLEDLRPQPVDLAVLVEEVFGVLDAPAAEAAVGLERTGDHVEILADPRRLKEALFNLVANAIEATPRGGKVRIDVRACACSAEVIIKDSGRGIAPEILPRIGTPFFTTRSNGTGLGVVLARAAVAQHGGEIRFSSEVGLGTTVELTLPSQPPMRSMAHGQSDAGR
jgi:signal transduction histidine kinase